MADRPNIVFLHVDQLHHAALSAYGNPYVHTPNMDAVVRMGYSFMRAYCTMPQCCPSRASWFTGRMTKEHGVVYNGCPLDPSFVDLAQWLRKHGYETIHAGKWHIPWRRVTESFERLLYPQVTIGERGDSAIIRSVIAYLLNRKEKRPFFLSIGLLNPHDCCYYANAVDRRGGPGKYAFAVKIKGDLPPLPQNFDYDYPKRGSGRIRHWTLQDWRYYIYTYYRLVEMVDPLIGWLFEALLHSPYADETLFILTTDHGEGLGFHAHIEKGFLEEEAWRVPMIVVWKGQIPSDIRDTEHLVSGADIAATVCDYAGVPPLPTMTFSLSWRPLLEGRPVRWRDHIIGETSAGRLSIAVRDKRYKSIFYSDGKVTLYDLENDPLEMKNLAEDTDFAPVVRQHREWVRQFVTEMDLYRPSPTVQAILKRLPPRLARLYPDYLRWYESLRGDEP